MARPLAWFLGIIFRQPQGDTLPNWNGIIIPLLAHPSPDNPQPRQAWVCSLYTLSGVSPYAAWLIKRLRLTASDDAGAQLNHLSRTPSGACWMGGAIIWGGGPEVGCWTPTPPSSTLARAENSQFSCQPKAKVPKKNENLLKELNFLWRQCQNLQHMV